MHNSNMMGVFNLEVANIVYETEYEALEYISPHLQSWNTCLGFLQQPLQKPTEKPWHRLWYTNVS